MASARATRPSGLTPRAAPAAETAKTTRLHARRGRLSALRHVTSRIADGTWPAGYQLPTERELSELFGIARNTLRKALSELEEQGLLERQVGRGTFVAEPADPEGGGGLDGTADALLARIHGASPVDVLELRLVLEPAFVELAAMRATSRHRQQIAHCLHASEKAEGVLEFEHWDGAFHHAILAAAQNSLLIDLYEAINGVREQPEWQGVKRRTLTSERLAQYRKQHRKLFKAFMDRDGAAARDAVRDHLMSVRDGLKPST